MTPDYERMLELVYRDVLRPGDVAIDIGAHKGRHSFPMAQAVGPSGKVFSFEPAPEIYTLLSDKIRSSSVNNIALFNFALGEESGSAEFVYVPKCPEYSGFKERVYHRDSLQLEKIQVAVRRLDSFASEFGRPRFIKIDAEGAELLILRGADSLIDATRPIISFELGDASHKNYDYTSADFFDFFAQREYSLFSIFGIRLVRKEFIEATSEQFFWDYLAIPNGQDWNFSHTSVRVLTAQFREVTNRPFRHLLRSIKARISNTLKGI